MYKRIVNILFLLIFPGILFSQNIRIKELHAFAEIKKENFTNAIDSLNNLISESQNPKFHLAKADVLFKLGNLNVALEECQKIDKIRSSYSSTLKLKIYLSLNDKENAQLSLVENLKSAYKIPLFDLLNNPEYSAIYNLGLDKSILDGNFYSQTEKQIYQVERLMLNEKYTQALFVINEMLARNNKIAQAFYLQSKIFYSDVNVQDALQSINSALNLKITPEYLLQRVIINRELKEFDKALQDINKLIRIDPFVVDHFIIKAGLLFKTGQFDEAINLSNSILKILPGDPDVLYLSSKSYYRNKDYFEALKAINQSMQIKSSKDFYELRGDIYSAANTYEYAIRDYSMYLDIDAYNGDIYAKKGFARLKLGDKKGACLDWEKGRRYGSYDAMQYLEKYCN